jgi:hypothetical protein
MLLNQKRIALLSTAALLLCSVSACSSEGGTRLGSVGTPAGSSASDGSSGGSDGSGGGSGGGASDGSGGSVSDGSGGGGSGGTTIGNGSGSGGNGSGSGGSGNTGNGGGSGSGSTGSGSGGSGTGGTGSGGTGSGGTGFGGTGSGGTGAGGSGDSGGNSGGSQGTSGLGGVLVTAGNAVLGVGDTLGTGVQPVNAALPGTAPITGSIVNTDRDLGQTLVDVGNGKQVLVRGVLGAVGDTVAITALNTNVTSPTTGTPLVGVGALSDSQPVGSLAALGVVTNGKAATATVNGVSTLLQEVTPGALSGLARLQVANAALGNGANPAIGVAALSNTAAVGTLASASVLPTNGGALVAANAPVVSQAVQTVTNTVGNLAGNVGATGLVGVTAGNAAIGSASPVVGVNVASSNPVSGSLATATVPVAAAVTPVANSVVPTVTAAVAPVVSTPVATVAAPVQAAVAPVASTVAAVAAPAVSTPVAAVAAPVQAVAAPVANAVAPVVSAVATPTASTPTAAVTAPVQAVVAPVTNSVVPAVGATVGAAVSGLGGIVPR